MNLQIAPQKIIKMAKKIRQKTPKNTARSDVVRMGEAPTPERIAKDIDFGGVTRIYEPESPNSVVMVLKHRVGAECWLDRYKRKGFLDAVEFAAGLMFRQAWQSLWLGIRTKDSILQDRIDNSHIAGAIMPAVGAEKCYQLCMKKLSAMQKIAVLTVCGQDEALGSKERVQTLRRGLDVIARDNGLISKDENVWLRRRLEEFL